MIACATCGQPIVGAQLDDRHWGHEPGCAGDGCACDLEYHAECCPECAA